MRIFLQTRIITTQKEMIFLPLFFQYAKKNARKNTHVHIDEFSVGARGGMLGEKVDKTSKTSRASSGTKIEYLVIGTSEQRFFLK